MKKPDKYVALLERELEFLRDLVGQSRKDVEFYRGKVERLELALMNNVAAQQSYASRTETTAAPRDIRERKFTEVKQRLPWSEVKRRWNAMSEADQEKAIASGWSVDGEEIEVKEEEHAGK